MIFNMQAKAPLLHVVHNITLTPSTPDCFRKSHAGRVFAMWILAASPQQLPSGQVNSWKNRGWDVIHTDPTPVNQH